MRALVVGGGSIGTRHLQNLRLLGVSELALVEPDEARRRKVIGTGLAVGLEDLASGIAWRPDFAIICTPTSLHASQALRLASHGIHLFIEKPLSHSLEGLESVSREVASRGLVTLVGCNMRFHPGPRRVKELLDEKRIGRVLFARLHFGSYLPNWRPWQDYRKSYSANAHLGGGVLLDSIHDIDLARWYLGPVDDVFCRAEHLSSLEMNVEDVAMLSCRHAGGVLSSIQLDYVQRVYDRGCHVAGETGTIFWDFRSGAVKLFEAEGERWTDYPYPQGYELNQMYIDELEHFLDCLRHARPTCCPVDEAIEVLKIALAAKASSRTGRSERTSEVR